MSTELPQNREAEEALLGAVLVYPQIMDEGEVARVTPEDFYIQRHREIWDAFRKVGKDLDVVSVSNVTGDPAYLTALITRTPSAMHATEYAKIVRSLASRRRDIRIASEIAQQAYAGEIDRAKLITMLADNQRVEGGAEHVRGALGELITQVEERSQNPRDIWGIPTGFYDLDHRIGGLQPEQTLMLSAPPGVGKSVLSMQIAKTVAESGVGVAIYSFEMSARRVLMRLISAESGVPTRAMNTGRMDGHWDAFYAATAKLDNLPLYIADIYGMTTADIRADVSNQNVKLIVVDYLNKLLDHDGGDDLANTKLKAQRMQSICREFGVAGILIQSMNKEGMRATTPSMADMSGPADAAHEGDMVFLMSAHPTESGVVQLTPAKMRDGDTGKAPINLRWGEGVPKFVNYVKTVSEREKVEYWHD